MYFHGAVMSGAPRQIGEGPTAIFAPVFENRFASIVEVMIGGEIIEARPGTP